MKCAILINWLDLLCQGEKKPAVDLAVATLLVVCLAAFPLQGPGSKLSSVVFILPFALDSTSCADVCLRLYIGFIFIAWK